MPMQRILHMTGGDIAGESLRNSGISGEVFVWRDILREWSADRFEAVIPHRSGAEKRE